LFQCPRRRLDSGLGDGTVPCPDASFSTVDGHFVDETVPGMTRSAILSLSRQSCPRTVIPVYQSGDLRVCDVGGRTMVVAYFGTADGGQHLELRDDRTGAVVEHVVPWYKEWWFDPADRHLAAFRHDGKPYVVIVTRRGLEYHVFRVTPRKLVQVADVEPSGSDFLGDIAMMTLDGTPTVVTCGDRVHFRHWLDGHEMRPEWRAPEGWRVGDPVVAGDRLFLWLSPHVSREVPTQEVWRVAMNQGWWLWEPLRDAPLGGPLKVRGYQWGPWPVAGRPVMLYKRDWRSFQVWDIARREPLGPFMGDLDLNRPHIGTAHGHRVLAAALDEHVRVWDVSTARQIAETALPRAVAVNIGPDNVIRAIDGRGVMARMEIPIRAVHPLARLDATS
jgi:hypothetical protein